MSRQKRHGIVEAAKDVVFPSRVLKRQLDEAQRRLHDLEDEYGAISREVEGRQRSTLCSDRPLSSGVRRSLAIAQRPGRTVTFAGELLLSPARDPTPSSRPLPSVPQTPLDISLRGLEKDVPTCSSVSIPNASRTAGNELQETSRLHSGQECNGMAAVSPWPSPRLLSPRSPRCLSTSSSSPSSLAQRRRRMRSEGRWRATPQCQRRTVQCKMRCSSHSHVRQERQGAAVVVSPRLSPRLLSPGSPRCHSTSSSPSPTVLARMGRRGTGRSMFSPQVSRRNPVTREGGVGPLMQSTPHRSDRQFIEAASYLAPQHGSIPAWVYPLPPSPPPPSLATTVSSSTRPSSLDSVPLPPSPPPNSAQTNSSFSPASVFLI